jgi:hypothetical protein
MIQNVQSNANIKKLSNEELGQIIETCESAISKGAAQIDDYEAFVLCQKELARRTWS